MKFWSALVIVKRCACRPGLSLQTSLHGKRLTPHCSGLWASKDGRGTMVGFLLGWEKREDPGDWPSENTM